MVTSSFPRFKGDYSGQHVYAQAVGLSHKHEVYVIYPTDQATTDLLSAPFHHRPFRYPFKTYPMAQVRGFDLLNVSRLYTVMRHEIKKIKHQESIDLFYAFWTIPSAFVCSFSCGETPYIIGLAGSDDKVFGRRGIARPFIGRAVNHASRIIALSQELKSSTVALGYREENISVIPSGIDTDIYKPRDKAALRNELKLPESFLILYLGSLFKLKRIDWLIRLSRQLGQKYQVHALIIGDGPERANLESIALELGADNVHFLGRVPYNEVPLYIAAADTLVLFSETEGLPSCIQEALASGLPVVATNVGGTGDIVQNNVNGYIINSEEEASSCLIRLLESPSMVSQMGGNARAFAEKYLASNRVFEQVDSVCESAINSSLPKTGDSDLTQPKALAGGHNIGIISTFPENLISRLIEVQSPYADNIHVMAPEAIQGDKVHFHPLKYKIGNNALSQIFNQVTAQIRMSWLVAILNKRVDFWIFLGGDVFLLPILTARFLGLPAMLSLLGNLEYETKLKKNALNPVLRFLRRLNCFFANRIIIYSSSLTRKWQLVNYKSKTIVAQSQYVDLDSFTVKIPLSLRHKLVGFVGRLSPEKGAWNFVQSIPLVLKQDPAVRFSIVGDGSLYAAIKNYIKTSGLDKQVDLVGKVPYAQIPDFVNKLRLLVLPSYSEGLPSTILEAMACGTPVLATPAGAVDDIISNGVTGFLMANNSPEAIARGIIEALNNNDFTNIADKARKLAETEYSLTAAQRNYKKVILAGGRLCRKNSRGTEYRPYQGTVQRKIKGEPCTD
jgi:glycosyltransferase involved in cell wall biosynthesis